MAKDANEILEELKEEMKYAISILGVCREAVLASKIGESFGGKPPRPVIMHATSRALTEVDTANLDKEKFMRGLISLCIFYLEDEDVSLALKLKEELDK